MGKASERRTERVKSLLLSTISEIIRDELSDPRIGIFSMTDLRLAKDLSTAEVLIATVGGKEATQASVDVLNRAAPLIWNRLRDETDLRHVPKLRFSPDVTGEYSDQVFKAIEDLKERGELTLSDDDADGGLMPPPHSGDDPQAEMEDEQSAG